MGAPLVGLLVVVVVLIALVVALRHRVVTETEKEQQLESGRTSTLTYLVPPGQDPAVLVAALERRGYATTTDVQGGPQRLLVEAADPADREEVRRIIGSTDEAGLEGGSVDAGEVRFHDERTP